MFRHVVMDHVKNLRWHSPSLKDTRSWEKQINREGFKVSKWTVVCSNHFVAGYYSDMCNVPTLYMKGYDQQPPKKRKEPFDRIAAQQPPLKKSRNVFRYGRTEYHLPVQSPVVNDHDYDFINDNDTCARCNPKFPCSQCQSKSSQINELLQHVQNLESQVQKLKAENRENQKRHFGIDDVKTSPRMMNVYTGIQNYELFKWLFNRIKSKAKSLNYVTRKGKVSGNGGPKRKLSLENEFFLTLVRLRLGLTEMDIAFRFKISQSTVSTLLRTWIPFLAREFQVFIHWPSKEEARKSLPKCFKKYPNTIGIIDCTEGGIEKPSIAKAQAQTYSSYKSKNTWKKLLCIAPCGTISFISKAYGGSASDRFITEQCGILNKLNAGDSIMADKGFNIGDLVVGKCAKLIVPPFLKDKIRFSKKNCNRTSEIAKARIHVERAIARIKDFKILQGAIPITIKNMLDDIFIIICSLTNLAPPLL